MSELIGHYACINPKCGSSDALAVYTDGDTYNAYCFSCNPRKGFSHNSLARSYLGDVLGIETLLKDREVKVVQQVKQRKEPLTAEARAEIEGNGGFDTTKCRGLSEVVNKKYGVITHYESGVPTHRFYPVTEKGVLTGYKGRELPKVFFSKGRNDNYSDLFGQSLFTPAKYLLIVGGEEDAMAAYQMLREDQIRRGHKEQAPIAVVSPTVGETSCVKQLQHNYKWLDQFEQIIVMFDNDEAGEEATNKVLEVLPMGKVKVGAMPMKDPNSMLESGLAKQFVQSFYNAKKRSPAGVVGSGDLMQSMLAKAIAPKVPLPSFMRELAKMLAGGFPLKAIINIIAGSGIGKTTWVNELVYHWAFHSPYKMGIVSLEADEAEYGNCLLSRHVGNKLSLIEDPQELEAYLHSEYVQAKAKELFTTEDGDDRFLLVDDRGDFESIQKLIEQMILSCGVQLIVIDPLSDMIDGLSNEEQALFMKWQKQMIKSHDVTFININHTRKGKDNSTAASRGAELSEEDIIGSSTIYKSASVNITLVRDKHAEDPVERNTTRVTLTKCRPTGYTGPAGKVFYDARTHTLMDLRDYMMVIPEGDLSANLYVEEDDAPY